MKLSEMRQILASENIRLTKSLGQNFLHDANQLRKIIEAASLEPSDRVLEIGPGLGPLTELLLERAAQVLAIEKDQRLAERLQARFGQMPNLSLITADALDYLSTHPINWDDWKMVSNLPYSVASPLLVDLALSAKPPRRMVATLQLEVAQRLVAKPGQDDYGLLSVLIQQRYEALGCFRISRTCFFPEPDVDSAAIGLGLRAHPELTQAQLPTFVSLVKLAFSQRRKMMFKLLKAQWPVDQLAEAFGKVPLGSTVRAEEVSVAQFIMLTRLLDEKRRSQSRSLL